MSVKKVAKSQYQAIVDQTLELLRPGISIPKEGWITTVRKSLGMSADQLAKRLGVTRSQVYQTEQAERRGGVTLKKMNQIAKGMDCSFIWVIVPYATHTSVQDMINLRAKKKALEILKRTNAHMALEDQSLSAEQLDFEIERLVDEIVRDMPKDFWEDE